MDYLYDIIREKAKEIEDEAVRFAKEVLDDEITISPGWADDGLSISVYSEGSQVVRAVFSLSELCDEPAMYWHGGVTVDREHYGLIKKIAGELREQADRLDDVLSKLTIREP